MFKKIDNYLLQKAPLLWLNQVHLLLIVWVVFILLAAVSYFSFKPTFEDLLHPTMSLRLTIPAFLIVIVAWVVLTNRYNPNNFHDKYTWFDDIKNYLLKIILTIITYTTVVHLIPASMNVLNGKVLSDQQVIDHETTGLIIGERILDKLAQNYLLDKNWNIEPIETTVNRVYAIKELSGVNKWAKQLYEKQQIKPEDFSAFYNFSIKNSTAVGYTHSHKTSNQFITSLEQLKIVEPFKISDNKNSYLSYNCQYNSIRKAIYEIKTAKENEWYWFYGIEYFMSTLALLVLLGTFTWLYQKIGGRSFFYSILCITLIGPAIGIIFFLLDEVLGLNLSKLGNSIIIVSLIVSFQLLLIFIAVKYFIKKRQNTLSKTCTLTVLISLPFIVFLSSILTLDRLPNTNFLPENIVLYIAIACILGFILLNILLRNTLTKIYNFPQSK